MKIYTRTGDGGETELFGGARIPKDALRIEAYGAVDELNAVIGVVRALKPPSKIENVLARVQNDLFIIGADLATPDLRRRSVPRIENGHTAFLERTIDAFEAALRPLKTFILPGGSASAAQLHFARTVCRRAERSAVRMSRGETINKETIVYLNRLSDLLFVLARYANRAARKREVSWSNRSRKK